jgi:putative RecB family exonuclease
LLLEHYRRAWSGYLSPFDRGQIAEGERILTAYVEKLGPTMPQTLYVEAPFDLQLGPHTVFGRLDRVDDTPDGLEIVDYKTAETATDPDTLQLDVYMLGLRVLAGRLAEKVSYYYLRSNEKVEFTRTAADAERTMALLEEMAREVEADWRFDPRPGPACPACQYTAYCPAVTADPRPLPSSGDEGQLQLRLDL